ncbi:hypothetical protein N0824_02837 [Microcystis sp. 0824]|uniref:Uncharacterized protein n=1 Tax=Microcystis aeruginosa NIES-2549 TaxID=1641812 RepID=A0A0F6U525_MICAE|nr:hypothetical protein MYAER_2882 [Microcystis aeruginosa NIES-2549]AOC53628.1 hypothetical protein amyaer_2921 [Microcystis aeruginosa NIES-2481]GBF54968.1 hypothetical protein N0824_02837 [Microcystis sp. 0824]
MCPRGGKVRKTWGISEISRGNNASIDKGFKDYQPSPISLYSSR